MLVDLYKWAVKPLTFIVLYCLVCMICLVMTLVTWILHSVNLLELYNLKLKCGDELSCLSQVVCWCSLREKLTIVHVWVTQPA